MSEAQQWQPDPFSRHQLRYFANGQPTSWVSDGGQVADESLASPSMPEMSSRPDSTAVEGSAGSVRPSAVITPTASSRQAGWYPDETGRLLRYWDGGNWTERTATLDPPQQDAVPAQPPQKKKRKRAGLRWLWAAVGILVALVAAVIPGVGVWLLVLGVCGLILLHMFRVTEFKDAQRQGKTMCAYCGGPLLRFGQKARVSSIPIACRHCGRIQPWAGG